MLLNDAKAKSLHVLKVIWQYLFTKKPEDAFCESNPYVINAQVFIKNLMDTLIFLPAGRPVA